MNGYQKTWTMRVVKTRHRITLSGATTVAELRKFLAAVPDDARFEDMDYHEDGDAHVIDFFHEAPETEGDV